MKFGPANTEKVCWDQFDDSNIIGLFGEQMNPEKYSSIKRSIQQGDQESLLNLLKEPAKEPFKFLIQSNKRSRKVRKIKQAEQKKDTCDCTIS